MNYSLKPWNTFGITQYANKIVCADNIYKLLHAWQNTVQCGRPVLIVGEGSNLLFFEDFAGTIIINRIMGITVNENNDAWHLHIGAGVKWRQLVQFTLKKNIPGLENLALIPGCVGSSPIQNIGAYGIEFKQVCEYVDCIELATGRLQRFSKKECRFGYRDSIFKNEYREGIAIIAVGLRLCKAWRPILKYGDLIYLDSSSVTLKQIFNTIRRMRLNKIPNPRIYGNAGSFFKNPIINIKVFQTLLEYWPNLQYHHYTNDNVKLSAGWLIEKCNLKGVSQGGAAVYHKQAMVLINKKDATSEDIINLARLVRQRVGETFNIWLEPEVRFIGHTGEVSALEVIS